MTDQRAIQKITALAEEIYPTHPMASAMLFTLAGALGAGPGYLRELWDATDQISRVHLGRIQQEESEIEREIRRRMN